MDKKDWFIKSRRLDIVKYWSQLPEDQVDSYIDHMNDISDTMMFGHFTETPPCYKGIAVRIPGSDRAVVYPHAEDARIDPRDLNA